MFSYQAPSLDLSQGYLAVTLDIDWQDAEKGGHRKAYFTRAAPSTCGRPKSNFLSAKVKPGCSEGGSPSSLGRKAPEFRTKELDGKV